MAGITCTKLVAEAVHMPGIWAHVCSDSFIVTFGNCKTLPSNPSWALLAPKGAPSALWSSPPIHSTTAYSIPPKVTGLLINSLAQPGTQPTHPK